MLPEITLNALQVQRTKENGKHQLLLNFNHPRNLPSTKEQKVKKDHKNRISSLINSPKRNFIWNKSIFFRNHIWNLFTLFFLPPFPSVCSTSLGTLPPSTFVAKTRRQRLEASGLACANFLFRRAVAHPYFMATREPTPTPAVPGPTFPALCALHNRSNFGENLSQMPDTGVCAFWLRWKIWKMTHPRVFRNGVWWSRHFLRLKSFV